MRPIRLVLAAVLVSAALAACSASESPGWTYAPAPSPTPTPVASTDVSPMPSVASAVPSGGPSEAPGGAVIELAAQNIAYSKDSILAPAGQSFQIHFSNMDAGVPHNVEIKDASGTVVFKGDIITGVSDTIYTVPALGTGNYQFVCTVHPNMVGTLVVG
jgi:plastocyanin